MSICRLLCWNVNGIRAVQKKGFLEWLQCESPDILTVQETKAHPEQLSDELLNSEGYHSYFASAQRKGYSGVGLWSKVKPKKVMTGFGIEKFDSEGRTICADFEKFRLYCVYFPNGGQSDERLQYKYDFYDAFLDHLKKVKKKQPNIVVCGDVNTAHQEIDLARPKENENHTGFLADERAWIDRLLASGFYDSFRLFNDQGENYTWWDYKTRARSRNVGWRIDYFFVSQALKEQVAGAEILSDVPGSDHCPIELRLKL